MLYDQFFHDVVPQPVRNLAVNSEVFPLALAMARSVTPHMKIVSVTPKPGVFGSYYRGDIDASMILGTHVGFPVVQIGKRQDYFRSDYVQQFYIKSWVRNFKAKGREQDIIAGKTPGYVRSSFKKSQGGDGMIKICQKAHQLVFEAMNAAAHMAVNAIDEEVNKSGEVRLYDFETEDLIQLLRLYKEDILRIHIPEGTRSRLERLYKKNQKYLEYLEAASERKKEYFKPPKWVLGYTEGVDGYFIGSVQYDTEGKVIPESMGDMRLYSSMEEFYAKRPNEARSLMASHAFFRTYMQQHHASQDYADPNKLIPSGDHAWLPVGATSWYRTRNPSAPQYLVLDKVPC